MCIIAYMKIANEREGERECCGVAEQSGGDRAAMVLQNLTNRVQGSMLMMVMGLVSENRLLGPTIRPSTLKSK